MAFSAAEGTFRLDRGALSPVPATEALGGGVRDRFDRSAGLGGACSAVAAAARSGSGAFARVEFLFCAGDGIGEQFAPVLVGIALVSARRFLLFGQRVYSAPHGRTIW